MPLTSLGLFAVPSSGSEKQSYSEAVPVATVANTYRPFGGGLSLRRSDERLRAEFPALACPRDRRELPARTYRTAHRAPVQA